MFWCVVLLYYVYELYSSFTSLQEVGGRVLEKGGGGCLFEIMRLERNFN